jgi:hypothetical protein
LADELAAFQVGEWTGPRTWGNGRSFFQITDARPGSGKDLLKEGEVQRTAQRLLDSRQSIWFEGFIKSERKKLGVKILAGELTSSPTDL